MTIVERSNLQRYFNYSPISHLMMLVRSFPLLLDPSHICAVGIVCDDDHDHGDE